MSSWSLPEELAQLGLKHPSYRPGWVVRDGEVVHLNVKAAWLLEHGDRVFEVAPIRSLLLLAAEDHLPELARRSWMRQVGHLGLMIKKGTPIDTLCNSENVEGLRSLHLNWSWNDPSNFPPDLTPKTLRGLLDSPLLAHLESLRTSVSSVKLHLEIVSACGHLHDLGLRTQGGFSREDGARIGAAMELPALRSLSISSGVAPKNAPSLRALRVRGGDLPPEEADLSQLEDLRLDQVFAPNLARILDTKAPALRRLFVVGARPDQASEVWRALAAADLPALTSLTVFGAPVGAAELEEMAGSGAMARWKEATLEPSEPDALVPHAAALSRLTSLTFAGFDRRVPVVPVLPELRRLGLGAHSGEEGDGVLATALALPRPGLEQLAMAREHGRPGVTESGARRLLEQAPESLRHVYLRCGKLPKNLTTELAARFDLHDGGIKLTSPLNALCDWTWPWLPWGPPTWAIDED